jgi:hypothetical protein
MGGFIVTIPIRLILYIIYMAPIVSPPLPFPTPLKAIARGFLVLFHIGIWSPPTIYHHLNLLSSPSLLSIYPPSPEGTHCAYFIVLVFIINMWIDVQSSVSMYALCGCALLWSVQSLRLLSLISLLPPPIFQQLSVHIHISSTFTSVVDNTTVALPFSFPFSLTPVLYSSYTVTNMFYNWVCIWSCLFLCICLSLNLSSTNEKKYVSFVFLILADFT